MTGRQFAILCALALTWGCSFLFIKVIIDAGVEPMGMSGFRTALGAATLLPFAWRARAGFRQPRAGPAGLPPVALRHHHPPGGLSPVSGDAPTGDVRIR